MAATSVAGIARLEIEGTTVSVVADTEADVANLVRALSDDGCRARVAEQGHPGTRVEATIEVDVDVPRPTPTEKP